MSRSSPRSDGSRRVLLAGLGPTVRNLRRLLPMTTFEAIWRDLEELKQPILMRVNVEDVLAKHVLPHWMLRQLLGYLRSPLSHWVLILTLACWAVADFSELFWLQCIAMVMASFTISCYVSTANLHGALLSFGAFEPLFLLFCCVRCCVATVITASYALTGQVFFCLGLVGFVIFWASIDSTQIQRRSRICMNVWILLYWSATWYYLVTLQRFTREMLIVRLTFIGDLQIEVDWASQLEHSLATLMVFAAKDIVAEAFKPGESKYLMKPVRFVWFDPGDESGCLKRRGTGSSLKRVTMRLDHQRSLVSDGEHGHSRSAVWKDDDEDAMCRMPSRYLSRSCIERELFIWSLLSLRVGGNLAEAVYQELSTRGSERVEEEAFLRGWPTVAGKRPALQKLSEDLGHDASRIWAAILMNSETAVAVRLIQRQFKFRRARKALTQAKLMWSVVKRRPQPQASSSSLEASSSMLEQPRKSRSSDMLHRAVSLVLLEENDDRTKSPPSRSPRSRLVSPECLQILTLPSSAEERLETGDIGVEICSDNITHEADIAPSFVLGSDWQPLPMAPSARPRTAKPKLAALQHLHDAIHETKVCDASTSDGTLNCYVVPREGGQSAGLPVGFRPNGGRRVQSGRSLVASQGTSSGLMLASAARATPTQLKSYLSTAET